MTHEEFRDKLKKAMGGKIPMDARPTWANFLRTRATEFWMNYEWVRHNGFWEWAYDSPDVDAGLGGTFGTTVMIMRHGEIGHGNTAV